MTQTSLMPALRRLISRPRTICLAIREAWWDRDRRSRIAEMLEREHVDSEKLELVAQTFAAMARTLEAIRCLPETGEPPARS